MSKFWIPILFAKEIRSPVITVILKGSVSRTLSNYSSSSDASFLDLQWVNDVYCPIVVVTFVTIAIVIALYHEDFLSLIVPPYVTVYPTPMHWASNFFCIKAADNHGTSCSMLPRHEFCTVVRHSAANFRRSLPKISTQPAFNFKIHHTVIEQHLQMDTIEPQPSVSTNTDILFLRPSLLNRLLAQSTLSAEQLRKPISSVNITEKLLREEFRVLTQSIIRKDGHNSSLGKFRKFSRIDSYERRLKDTDENNENTTTGNMTPMKSKQTIFEDDEETNEERENFKGSVNNCKYSKERWCKTTLPKAIDSSMIATAAILRSEDTANQSGLEFPGTSPVFPSAATLQPITGLVTCRQAMHENAPNGVIEERLNSVMASEQDKNSCVDTNDTNAHIFFEDPEDNIDLSVSDSKSDNMSTSVSVVGAEGSGGGVIKTITLINTDEEINSNEQANLQPSIEMQSGDVSLSGSSSSPDSGIELQPYRSRTHSYDYTQALRFRFQSSLDTISTKSSASTPHSSTSTKSSISTVSTLSSSGGSRSTSDSDSCLKSISASRSRFLGASEESNRQRALDRHIDEQDVHSKLDPIRVRIHLIAPPTLPELSSEISDADANEATTTAATATAMPGLLDLTHAQVQGSKTNLRKSPTSVMALGESVSVAVVQPPESLSPPLSTPLLREAIDAAQQSLLRHLSNRSSSTSSPGSLAVRALNFDSPSLIGGEDSGSTTSYNLSSTKMNEAGEEEKATMAATIPLHQDASLILGTGQYLTRYTADQSNGAAEGVAAEVAMLDIDFKNVLRSFWQSVVSTSLNSGQQRVEQTKRLREERELSPVETEVSVRNRAQVFGEAATSLPRAASRDSSPSTVSSILNQDCNSFHGSPSSRPSRSDESASDSICRNWQSSSDVSACTTASATRLLVLHDTQTTNNTQIAHTTHATHTTQGTQVAATTALARPMGTETSPDSVDYGAHSLEDSLDDLLYAWRDGNE